MRVCYKVKLNTRCWNCNFRFNLNTKKPYSLLPDFEQRIFKCGSCNKFMLIFADGRNMNPLRWPHLQKHEELLAQMGEAKPLRVVPIHKADDSKEAPEVDTRQLVIDRERRRGRSSRFRLTPKALADKASPTFDIRDENGQLVKEGYEFRVVKK